MRSLIILVSLCCFSTAALADPNPDERKARSTEIAGAVLTSMGLGLGAASIGIWASGKWDTPGWDDRTPPPTQEQLDGAALQVGGVATAVSATVFLAVGIPLWVVSAHKRKQAQRAALSVTRAGLAF